MLNFKSTGKVKTVDTQHPDDDGNVETYCELTQAEYDALSVADKNNGVVYYITDSYGGYTPGQALIDLIYPIGSVYISNTNTNPSTNFGGTWTLIDKEFSDTYINSASLFHADSTTVTEVTSLLFRRHGHDIQIRITLTPAVELNDNTVEFGYFDLSTLGLNALFSGYTVGFDDGGNGIALVQINSANNNLALRTVDVITKTSGGVIAAGNAMTMEFYVPIRMGIMLDSVCDRFYWKRTA